MLNKEELGRLLHANTLMCQLHSVDAEVQAMRATNFTRAIENKTLLHEPADFIEAQNKFLLIANQMRELYTEQKQDINT